MTVCGPPPISLSLSLSLSHTHTHTHSLSLPPRFYSSGYSFVSIFSYILYFSTYSFSVFLSLSNFSNATLVPNLCSHFLAVFKEAFIILSLPNCLQLTIFSGSDEFQYFSVSSSLSLSLPLSLSLLFFPL